MKATPRTAVPAAKVRKPIEIFGNVTVLLCGAAASAGALYFGIASCGGPTQHGEVFRVVSVFLYLASLALPSTLLPWMRRKVGFALLLPAGYVLLESAVAPLYPGPPTSLAEYGALLVRAVVYGPCG